MITNIRAIIVVAALGALAAFCGCTNEPGALKMTVEPEKPVFRSDEPLRLKVTLEAVKGPVCLWESCYLKAHVVAEDGSTKLEAGTIALCGTGKVVTLPLFPILLTAAVFDVGDGMGRFTVVKEGQSLSFQVTIEQTEFGKVYAWRDPDPELSTKTPDSPNRLLPGSYRIRVALSNRPSSSRLMNLYPAPMFWKPYDRDVTASVDVKIEEPPAVVATSGAADDEAGGPRVEPERRGEPEPANGGILAAPPGRITRAALVRGFEPDGCLLSTEPDAQLPEAVAKHIELARAALERKKLLPPEWKLCAAQADDGSWLVRCTPRGKALRAAWVPTTVLIRDGKVEDICEFQVFDPRASDGDE